MPAQYTPEGLPEETLYFNQWSGFRSNEIRALFECIPLKDAGKLEDGATIWIDGEWPRGKMYGFRRANVVKITASADGLSEQLSVQFDGPATSGVARVTEHGWHKVHRCTDPTKLAELVNKYPLATDSDC